MAWFIEKGAQSMFLQGKPVHERQRGTMIWGSEFGVQSQVNPAIKSSFACFFQSAETPPLKDLLHRTVRMAVSPTCEVCARNG